LQCSADQPGPAAAAAAGHGSYDIKSAPSMAKRKFVTEELFVRVELNDHQKAFVGRKTVLEITFEVA
jgi:hypothetical protein